MKRRGQNNNKILKDLQLDSNLHFWTQTLTLKLHSQYDTQACVEGYNKASLILEKFGLHVPVCEVGNSIFSAFKA